MPVKSIFGDLSEFLKRRCFLILWISLVLYLFYDTFMFYKNGRQFYRLRKILGIGLCFSRGTATILNLCGALILLPLCKKMNQLLYRMLSKLSPGLFFMWLEKAKSFHMTVAITLVLFAVLHSFSHFANLWNFSRGYDEECGEINFANFRNENPFRLILSLAGLTGFAMLLITIGMGLTSTRFMRRRFYNAFWYTHQLYLVFMVLFIIHPLSGVLKEEVINEPDLNPSQYEKWTNTSMIQPNLTPIKSKTWLWMSIPLSCFFIDLLWRIFTRNRAVVDILEVTHLPGRTISLTLSCPHEKCVCRNGQYVLLQCPSISLIEWHPFTVVKVPAPNQRNFVLWIRITGDWTEALEKLLMEKIPQDVRILVDGPFSSPMEGASNCEVAICVAAGVGITPFVAMLEHMLKNPRSRRPSRVHLIWIVRHERELTWLAELVNTAILKLRDANRPDRLHLQFYITNNDLQNNVNKTHNRMTHTVIINEKGVFNHVLNKTADEERVTLLTPYMKRSCKTGTDSSEKMYTIAQDYPLLGCRVKRGRPYWDRVFGYWVHLYPGNNLYLYCCGPKKLVKILNSKCKYTSRTTKTHFTFVHEGFS